MALSAATDRSDGCCGQQQSSIQGLKTVRGGLVLLERKSLGKVRSFHVQCVLTSCGWFSTCSSICELHGTQEHLGLACMHTISFNNSIEAGGQMLRWQTSCQLL